MTDANDGAPTFDRDIKPLFRERDRSSMLAFFDVWSFDDVEESAGAILETESRPTRALGRIGCGALER